MRRSSSRKSFQKPSIFIKFLKKRGMKPIGKGYFAVSINANEQFNYFKVLVKWLFQVNEIQTGDYTKYDDPLTVASNIRKN